MKALLFLALAIAASGRLAPGQVIHVDDTATGANDGTSWQDAFTDLQSALAVAAYTDQVWVARGTYKPTSTLDRTATFEVDCQVYGGFDGTEASLDERAGLFDETILTGDLLWDDGPGFANRGENSLHVAYVPTFLFHTIVLDGFTVRGGNANLDPYRIGGGLFVEFFTSFVHVRNCTFTANEATSGGGIGCPGKSSLLIERCTFVDNRATYGGGVNAGADTVLRSCVLLGNRARYGGGLFFGVRAIDCVFSGNHALRAGGGAISTTEIANCTFAGNTARIGGGVFEDSPHHMLANCVLWGNADGSGDAQSGQIAGEFAVQECIVEGWDGTLPGPGTVDADPLLRSPLGADGIAGTPDDDLRVLEGSPCIDTGFASVSGGLGVDALGRPRSVDSLGCDGGGVLDRGALERQVVDGTSGYCSSLPSSLGVDAVIGGPCTVTSTSGPISILARPVPDTRAFLLLGEPGPPLPFGDGNLCLAGSVQHVASSVPSGGTVEFSFDPSALSPGDTVGLQVLFRDPAAGGAGFNLSSAMRLYAIP